MNRVSGARKYRRKLGQDKEAAINNRFSLRYLGSLNNRRNHLPPQEGDAVSTGSFTRFDRWSNRRPLLSSDSQTGYELVIVV